MLGHQSYATSSRSCRSVRESPNNKLHVPPTTRVRRKRPTLLHSGVVTSRVFGESCWDIILSAQRGRGGGQKPYGARDAVSVEIGLRYPTLREGGSTGVLHSSTSINNLASPRIPRHPSSLHPDILARQIKATHGRIDSARRTDGRRDHVLQGERGGTCPDSRGVVPRRGGDDLVSAGGAGNGTLAKQKFLRRHVCLLCAHDGR